ncbi:MAG: hypothetical protein M3112_05090 [Actinomycetia bacterium]|nr:hypothetical protein [Actinomycetes bacterium]
MAGCSAAGTDTTSTLAPPSTAVSTTTTTIPELSPDVLDIQGHRGARGLQPENTLPAFETALDIGVTTLEFDLHFTADDDVVVWHDATIDPAKCGLSASAPDGVPDPDDATTADEDLMIRSLTTAQLAHYRCDRNPNPARFPDQTTDTTALAGDDYSIVTLEKLLDFVATYADSNAKTDEQRTSASVVFLNMETKRKPKTPETIDDGFDGVNAGPFELAILEIIAERGLEERVILQSFDHRSLWSVHQQNPTLRLAALSKGVSVDFEDIAVRGASIWSSDYNDVNEGTLDAAHRAGLEVIPWTVNDPDLMDRLVELGVDGLITDRPDVAPSNAESDG